VSAAMTDRSPEHARARRRFATLAAAMAVVLLVGGFLLSRGTGDARDLGVTAVGFGLGVAVAAVFLALGCEPGGRR
jgi:hypothetical protein